MKEDAGIFYFWNAGCGCSDLLHLLSHRGDTQNRYLVPKDVVFKSVTFFKQSCSIFNN